MTISCMHILGYRLQWLIELGFFLKITGKQVFYLYVDGKIAYDLFHVSFKFSLIFLDPLGYVIVSNWFEIKVTLS